MVAQAQPQKARGRRHESQQPRARVSTCGVRLHDETARIVSGSAPGRPLAVRIDSVSKSFGAAVAVSDVSFTLASDELLVLVGPLSLIHI